MGEAMITQKHSTQVRGNCPRCGVSNEAIAAAEQRAMERAAVIAEEYQHAWGEDNNPICGLVAAAIRNAKEA